MDAETIRKQMVKLNKITDAISGFKVRAPPLRLAGKSVLFGASCSASAPVRQLAHSTIAYFLGETSHFWSNSVNKRQHERWTCNHDTALIPSEPVCW
jgi:hypothetical protein